MKAVFIFSVHFHGQRKTLPWKEYNQGQGWLIADFINVWDGRLAFFTFLIFRGWVQCHPGPFSDLLNIVWWVKWDRPGISVTTWTECRSRALALRKHFAQCHRLSFTLDLLSKGNPNKRVKPKKKSRDNNEPYPDFSRGSPCDPSEDITCLCSSCLNTLKHLPAQASLLSLVPKERWIFFRRQRDISGIGLKGHTGRKSKGDVLGESPCEAEAAALYFTSDLFVK